jgi:preprotein translocase subunit SecG
MYQFLIILIVIAAVVLTLVVLVQNSKGGGLAAGFSSANQVFGVRKTTERIEKITWGLIAGIVVLSVSASAFHKDGLGTQSASALAEEAAEASAPQQQQQQQPAAEFPQE